MPKNWSKSERKELRRLAGLSYERGLSKALEELEEAFREWRRGEMSAIDLNEVIHGYHQGPSRDIWAQFVRSKPAMAVAYALATNILDPEEVSERLRQELEAWVELFRDEEESTR